MWAYYVVFSHEKNQPYYSWIYVPIFTNVTFLPFYLFHFNIVPWGLDEPTTKIILKPNHTSQHKTTRTTHIYPFSHQSTTHTHPHTPCSFHLI